MRLKLTYCILWTAVIMSVAGACSENMPTSQEDRLPCAITLEVKGKTDIPTRTPVHDPDDAGKKGRQHVTRVQLYIYEKDANGPDYSCVASEDVKWMHLHGAMEGLETRKQGYTTVYQDYKTGVDYRFVAMGFDDTFTGSPDSPIFGGNNSVAAYGSPENIVTMGEKLSAGNFTLQAGAPLSLIGSSELFAGAQTFTREQLENGTASMIPIEMKRRIAGVLGYFKNLPSEIEHRKVAKVALRLYDSQNTKVPVIPRLPDGVNLPEEVTDDNYIDYVLSPYAEAADGRQIALYQVPAAGPDATFTMSAYMLPMQAPSGKDVCTMELVIMDEAGTALATRRILYNPQAQNPATRNGTGIIGDEKNARVQYPVRANHFYRIGTRKNPIDLSGRATDIYLYIDDVWDEYYGGTLDGVGNGGMDIDNAWGSHDGGSLSAGVTQSGK